MEASDQRYVKGGVPPVAFATVMLPVASALQTTLVGVTTSGLIIAFSEITTENVLEQPAPLP